MFFIFNTNPRFPPFYYMLGANLGLLLHGEVTVMTINNNMHNYDFIGGFLNYVMYVMS